MNRIITALSVSIMALSPLAIADNTSAQSSAFGGEGGTGGAGGTGIGNGGMGGTGIGGEAHGGAGGVGQGGLGQGGIGQGGTGTGGDAINTGNAQTLQFNQARQSPSGFAFAPMPTATCQGSFGVFASFIAGLGFSMSHTLDQCAIGEEARTMAGMGRADLGVKILCKNAKYASQLDECKVM